MPPPCESVEKVAGRHFFEFLRVLPLALAPGLQNPKGMKNLKAFIPSDVHAVRAGISLRLLLFCRFFPIVAKAALHIS